MEQPSLIWSHEQVRMQTPAMIGVGTMPPPNSMRDGWYLSNPNPRPISIEHMSIVGRYKRWFGGYVERVMEIGGIRLAPGGDYKVRPQRPPPFSTLSSHTLALVISYGPSRYKLDNYRRPDLFAPQQTLTLRFFDRVW